MVLEVRTATNPDTVAATDPTEIESPSRDADLNERFNKIEKEQTWVREALGHLVRNHMGEITQAGLTTTLTTLVAGGQIEGQGSIFSPSAERTRGDGILPSPPMAIPLRQTENILKLR